MTAWKPLEPRRSGPRRTTEPVISASRSGSSGIRVYVRLPIALCARLLWAIGSKIEVASNQEAGITRLRLRVGKEGSGYTLRSTCKGGTYYIGFSPPTHPLIQTRPAQTVKHVITEEGLILTVPAWAAIGDPPLPARKDAA